MSMTINTRHTAAMLNDEDIVLWYRPECLLGRSRATDIDFSALVNGVASLYL